MIPHTQNRSYSLTAARKLVREKCCWFKVRRKAGKSGMDHAAAGGRLGSPHVGDPPPSISLFNQVCSVSVVQGSTWSSPNLLMLFPQRSLLAALLLWFCPFCHNYSAPYYPVLSGHISLFPSNVTLNTRDEKKNRTGKKFPSG